MEISAEAKALRWTANMLGGTEQEKGFPRTVAHYCVAGANSIESLQEQLADKAALLDAAIAGQETLQRAWAVTLDIIAEAEGAAIDFIESGPYEDANTAAIHFAKHIIALCNRPLQNDNQGGSHGND